MLTEGSRASIIFEDLTRSIPLDCGFEGVQGRPSICMFNTKRFPNNSWQAVCRECPADAAIAEKTQRRIDASLPTVYIQEKNEIPQRTPPASNRQPTTLHAGKPFTL